MIIHPFKSPVNNILELVNEFFYGLVLGILYYLNTEEKWEDYEDFFFNVLLANSYLIVAIMIGKFKVFS